MKNAWIWVVVVVVIVVGGIVWYQSAQTSQIPVTQIPSSADTTGTPAGSDNQASGTGASVDVGASVGTPTTATVTYTDSGFSPANVTIKKGGTVTFVDQSGSPMDIASDPHPNHNGYDGTGRTTHCASNYTGAKPFDQCAPGTSFSFTFDKVGSWGYHNHMNEADGGVVNVVQ